MSRQSPRVDATDARYPKSTQIVVEPARGLRVAWFEAVLAHDKASNPGVARFILIRLDSVITDQRIRHAHNLPAERRIGADLLVTDHRGCKDDFPFGV